MARARSPAGTTASSSAPAGRRITRATTTVAASPAAMPPVDASPPAPPPCRSTKRACPPTRDAAATAATATATGAGSRARRTARSVPAPTPSTMARPCSETTTWVPPTTMRSTGSTPERASSGPGCDGQPHESRGRAAERSISGRIADSSHARFFVRNGSLRLGVADDDGYAGALDRFPPPRRCLRWSRSRWRRKPPPARTAAGSERDPRRRCGEAGAPSPLPCTAVSGHAPTSPAFGRAVRGGAAPERAGNRDLGLVRRRQGLEARRRQLGELLARTHGDVDGVAEPAKVLFSLLHAHEHLGAVVGARPVILLDVHVDQQLRLPRRRARHLQDEIVLRALALHHA